MSRWQPDEPDPHHRQWLHAMEDEPTVPSEAMQIGRVYADHGARSEGRAVVVTYPAMRRQTHLSPDAINTYTKWLADNGWLTSTNPEWKTGQRKPYDLTIGRPGENNRKRKPPQRAGRPEGLDGETKPDHYASRSGSEDPDRYAGRSGRADPDRFASRSATTTAGEAQPLRQAKRERLTSRTSLSAGRGSLHAALAAVVPDVTERETELVREMIAARPRVDSPGAILRTEIRDGNGPNLVDEVRRRGATGATRRPATRPSDVSAKALCPRCSRTGHDAANCPDRDPAPPRPSAGPVLLATAVEPCVAGERCHRPPTPIDPATGYHARCGALATVRASLARAHVPAAGAVRAAEQVAEARAIREAAELAGSEAVA